MQFKSLLGCLLALLAVGLSGCGDASPIFGKVTGQLLVKGKPAGNVRVEFHPDAVAGTVGPSSYAETDENGRFVLTYSTPKKAGEGAVVGRHKVVLLDMRLAQSETGEGIPIRFGPEFASVGSTPLSADVKAGEQSVKLEATSPAPMER